MSKEFIKQEEGLRLTSYKCQAGKWTIGYGCTTYETGDPVERGEVISLGHANELFDWHYNVKAKFLSKVLALLNITLNENQFNSLVSFIFNIGEGAFSASTLLKCIAKDKNDRASISYQFSRWSHILVNGKWMLSESLLGRRQRETELYFTPVK